MVHVGYAVQKMTAQQARSAWELFDEVLAAERADDYAEIGEFRRLDTPAEIRDLAKTWQNCLTDYISNVNHGTSAIYLSDQLEAVCFLCRHGRMGWFLVQTKGPKNVAIAPDQLAQIHAAFADAGIPQSSMIEAIKSIIKTDEWPRYHPELDADENFDDIALY
jgi:hypothetical protein